MRTAWSGILVLGILVLGLLGAVTSPAALAGDVTGIWLTDDGEARIRIEQCGEGYCGRIAWLREPLDESGQPKYDRYNEDERLRERPIVGISLIYDLRPTGPGAWGKGRIYNPRDGKSYRVSLRLSQPDELAIEGCLLVFCRSQTWRRVE